MKKQAAEYLFRKLGVPEMQIPFALFLVDFFSLQETGRPVLGSWKEGDGKTDLKRLSGYDVKLIKRVVSVLKGKEPLFEDETKEERFRTFLFMVGYEGPPSPEEVERLSKKFGKFWAGVDDVDEEIRRLRE